MHRRGWVTKLITRASSHHGSELARLDIGANGQQLRPLNRLLTALNQREREPSPVPIASIYGWHDNLVLRQAPST